MTVNFMVCCCFVLFTFFRQTAWRHKMAKKAGQENLKYLQKGDVGGYVANLNFTTKA